MVSTHYLKNFVRMHEYNLKAKVNASRAQSLRKKFDSSLPGESTPVPPHHPMYDFEDHSHFEKIGNGYLSFIYPASDKG